MEINFLNVLFLALPTVITVGLVLLIAWLVFSFIASKTGKITAAQRKLVRSSLIFVWAVASVVNLTIVTSNHMVKNKVVSSPTTEYRPQVRDVPEPNSDFLQKPESRFGKFDERINNELVDK